VTVSTFAGWPAPAAGMGAVLLLVPLLVPAAGLWLWRRGKHGRE
jgi:hypothetical protein